MNKGDLYWFLFTLSLRYRWLGLRIELNSGLGDHPSMCSSVVVSVFLGDTFLCLSLICNEKKENVLNIVNSEYNYNANTLKHTNTYITYWEKPEFNSRIQHSCPSGQPEKKKKKKRVNWRSAQISLNIYVNCLNYY